MVSRRAVLLVPLFFLLYINDIPNCSDKLLKLLFRIFADDTNIFASSSNAVELQSLINQELSKVKEWCDLNKLSINLTKTNYMIIKSPKRKTNIIWVYIWVYRSPIYVLESLETQELLANLDISPPFHNLNNYTITSSNLIFLMR